MEGHWDYCLIYKKNQKTIGKLKVEDIEPLLRELREKALP